MTAKVIVPIDITTGVGAGLQLLANSATETAYADWVTSTAYTVGNNVKYNHRKYECLAAHTSGPTKLPGAVGGTTWLDLGPTNHWAMFDQEVSSSTSATGSLTVSVKPATATLTSFFDTVAVLAVTGAASVRVQVFNGTGRATGAGGVVGGDLVYTSTTNLDSTFIGDMYQYYFAPFEVKTEVIFGNIPPYLNAEVVLTITGTTGGITVTCGALICGLSSDLGEVQMGATAGITDYSIKQTDGFGITTLVRRNFAKRTTYSLVIANDQIRRVYSVLAELRAVPCVWIGSSNYAYSPLVVFGFYEDFDINVAYASHSTASLRIQGMI